MAQDGKAKGVESSILAANKALLERFAFGETQDFEDAARGLLGTREDRQIRDAEGRVVWDLDAYAFLRGECPDTVNPSLWRQGQLVIHDGLFEVTEGVYQIRGFDLSNMTLVEGDTGVLVIDPLLTVETAAAGLALYRAHRGERPVRGVVYTHSHADHFGGVKGVVSEDEVAGGVPVLAPEGFLEHAVSENVYAGAAMNRRAAYMYGAALPPGVQGQVGAGLGQTLSTGSVSLIPPTVTVTRTGQVETVDGVRMDFQLTPGTEAPAELNIHFPDRAALCMAENATHNLHNLLTLRGAQVRDPHVWARFLSESLDLFLDGTEVAFASHHWPVWGREGVERFLSEQHDVYAYLHDQTLRMLNQGLTGPEIAERMQVPPALERAWHTHGYYGSVSHNTKAIYQRYLGWFDGNPAHLWEHPPAEAAARYVAFMGGADKVLDQARRSFAEGDYRWVVQVVNHVVFADPGNSEARALQADAFEQLGYGSENGTWRNFYLMGAYELRNGSVGTPTATTSADVLAALTLDQLFDALAIRVDGPRCWDKDITVRWNLTDGPTILMRLRNGVLSHRISPTTSSGDAHVEITLSEADLRAVLLGELSPSDLANRAQLSGDPTKLTELLGCLSDPDPDFAIVTP
ncbi:MULTISPECIES: alkyl/aryl-sulfatase [Streptacidiphilus]|uniref:Alkyl/aryl-sulfatase n=1 Tax=Streptacidiphilus cavernicola TaxID=3342716 RepID=A0ABV6UH98_9ACTN|nr:alkyl sulfatase dimerization domain-containing protein [Streptacidiphilus jeojiense]